jgi:hypothetical protein
VKKIAQNVAQPNIYHNKCIINAFEKGRTLSTLESKIAAFWSETAQKLGPLFFAQNVKEQNLKIGPWVASVQL